MLAFETPPAPAGSISHTGGHIPSMCLIKVNMTDPLVNHQQILFVTNVYVDIIGESGTFWTYTIITSHSTCYPKGHVQADEALTTKNGLVCDYTVRLSSRHH